MDETKIMSDVAYRSLLLIDALNQVGLQPSIADIDTYATTRMPRDERLETTVDVVRMGFLKRQPAEPVVRRLIKLRWISENSGLKLTLLGKKVLEAQRLIVSQFDDAEQVCEVFNSPTEGDKLPLARLTSVARTAGSGMLVDPYFKAHMVPWLMEHTDIRKALVKKTSEASNLSIALGEMQGSFEKDLEIRVTDSKSFHDRCIIGNGEVWMIGTSVNSIQKNFSVVYPLPHEVISSYTEAINSFWDSAKKLDPKDYPDKAKSSEQTA